MHHRWKSSLPAHGDQKMNVVGESFNLYQPNPRPLRYLSYQALRVLADIAI